LKAYRLLAVEISDSIEALIISGENGELYCCPTNQIDFEKSFNEIFVRASDNPHNMSLI